MLWYLAIHSQSPTQSVAFVEKLVLAASAWVQHFLRILSVQKFRWTIAEKSAWTEGVKELFACMHEVEVSVISWRPFVVLGYNILVHLATHRVIDQVAKIWLQHGSTRTLAVSWARLDKTFTNWLSVHFCYQMQPNMDPTRDQVLSRTAFLDIDLMLGQLGWRLED